MPLLLEQLTRTCIGRFYLVYNHLGYGLLEAGYAGALEIELKKAGLHVDREVPVSVEYEGVIVGTYRVDLLVEKQLIIEVKTGPAVLDVHERQVRNYLKCSHLEVALLFLFGPKPAFRRFIHTNDRKHERVVPDSWPFPSEP